MRIAVYDRLERQPPVEPQFRQIMWRRRELENYLCTRETLLAFATTRGQEQQGELFGGLWSGVMEEAIGEIESALAALGKPSPWGSDIKASDDFLDPLFRKFYEKLGLPNLMRKTDYHTLAPFVPAAALDNEIRETLDLIAQTADQAKPRRD
ncbi:MAG: hypothetical protein WAV07_10110 [Candidatus Contendobacter sp.]